MIWVTFIFSYIFLSVTFSTQSPLHGLAQGAQNLCQVILNQAESSSLSEALFCGVKLPFGRDRVLFQKVGLYHILVVSGLHLNWVKRGYEFMTPKWAHSAIGLSITLAAYALFTGWQPPVVRALFEKLIPKQYFSEPVRILTSFFLCISLHPHWSLSLSLSLSVTARVAIFLCNRWSPWGFTLGIVSLISPLLFTGAPQAQLISFMMAPTLLGTLFSITLMDIWIFLSDSLFGVLHLSWVTLFEGCAFLHRWLQDFLELHLLFLRELQYHFPKTRGQVLLPKAFHSLYLCSLITLMQVVHVKRKRHKIDKAWVDKKTKPRYRFWALFLFLFIWLGLPQPTELNFKKTKAGKVYTQGLGHAPPARNKHNHRRHLAPSSEPGPLPRPLLSPLGR